MAWPGEMAAQGISNAISAAAIISENNGGEMAKIMAANGQLSAGVASGKPAIGS